MKQPHSADHVDTPLRAPPYAILGVVGAGAWGTALANLAAAGGAHVVLWARESDVIDGIATGRQNDRFLPGVPIHPNVEATGDFRRVSAAQAILFATPTQYLRRVLEQFRGVTMPMVLCAKGIEKSTGMLVTEVLGEILPSATPGILSGPSFARDVAQGLPTAVTIAAETEIAARLQATLGRASFRPYITDDLVGVALGGAAKNVYAIACGMVAGAGFGESARAAALARSFAELLRLGGALGARQETLMGLSGLGDLVLTATSMSSRNFALGVHLGQGMAFKDAAGEGKPLAEGADTAPALVARGKRAGIELPIAEAVADVLAGKIDFLRAAERLLARPMKAE